MTIPSFILCQTDAQVLDVLMDLDEKTVESEGGLDAVTSALAEKYKIDNEDMAWPSFDAFDSINRGKNESGEQFVLRFELSYSKVRSYDSEFTMSDRSLAMLCLRRMNITQEHRALILGQINGPITTRKIVKAIKKVFTSDVPQEITPKDKKEDTVSTDEKGVAFMAPEDDEMDDNDNAYFIRKGNKFFPARNNNHKNDNAMICERCGKPGHEAPSCMLT